MPDRTPCRVENATVRPLRQDALESLIRKMFERRHHPRVGGRETDWLTVELVQSLRQESEVYRERLSTKTDGPLPFALGYFRIRDGALELVSDRVPANVAPEPFARLLSEFVEPGARLWFGKEGDEEGWEVQDVGTVTRLTSEQESGANQG